MPSGKIEQLDQCHHLHPWEDMANWKRSERFVITHGKGIYLYDDQGRELIDGPAGMWAVQIGYGRKEMADAIAEQVMGLPYASPWSATTTPAALLADKVTSLAPGDLNTVMFTTGGSTAVDTAIRTMHFLNNRLGRPEKKIVIAREKGYHGSTYLAASVTGKERDKSFFDFEERRVHFLPDVNPYIRPDGMTAAQWCDAKVEDLERAIAELGPGNIGAFIAEPILCSGGVVIPPEGYHRRTLELCRKHDILYISDEVVTGFGRLGHWFASEDVFGIQPDFITCAKGITSGYLPLGACLISDRVMSRMTGEDHDVLFPNGYTYSAHPVCCAAALKNIEIIETEGLLEHVRAISPHFQDRLKRLEASPIIGDARGMGLLGCLEGLMDEGRDTPLSVQRNLGAKLDEACEARGLIVRPMINMCVFSPPLTISRDEIDRMFDIIEDAVRDVEKEFGAVQTLA
ncbi:aminotransferase [Roseovarius aestuariivivens]|uniref:aminotransferase n=1 Tax=Roseovarius aestuariivivens TaxID=1888910 RepID=UPI00247803AA|nr:aminotransferase [Roseovarius aestuariivivens]